MIAKNSRKVGILLTVYLFLAIYAPPIISLNMFHVITVFSLVMIILKYRYIANVILKKMRCTSMFYLIFINLFIIAIGAFTTLFSHDSRLKDDYMIALVYQAVIMMSEIIISTLYICCVIETEYSEDNGEKFFKSIVIAGIIEFLFVMISYFNPGIRTSFLSLMGSNTGLSDLYSNYSEYLNYRGYGFALELLDTFGYGTGIIGGIAFILGRPNKKYYFFAFCMLIATLLNSRTGLIMMALFISIDLVCGKNAILTRKKFILILLLMLLAILLWCVILPTFLNEIFMSTKDEILKNTARDLLQVLHFDYHTLQKEMWQFPDNIIYLMFGTGHLVTGTVSTVGFVNAIWAYGIVGTILLYALSSVMYVKTLRRCKYNYLYYNTVFALFIIFFVTQLKMPVFTYSAGGYLQFSIPMIVNYFVSKEKRLI